MMYQLVGVDYIATLRAQDGLHFSLLTLTVCAKGGSVSKVFLYNGIGFGKCRGVKLQSSIFYPFNIASSRCNIDALQSKVKGECMAQACVTVM